jgi:hypothetical protein
MSGLSQLSKYVKVSSEELKSLISSGTVNEIRISQEEVWIGGIKRCIHRIFSVRSDYSEVGWVLDQDSENCMICSKEFWLFVSKHHCRLCGNVVCSSCSESEVLIVQLPNDGAQRACVMCYWGQQVRISKYLDS